MLPFLWMSMGNPSPLGAFPEVVCWVLSLSLQWWWGGQSVLNGSWGIVAIASSEIEDCLGAHWSALPSVLGCHSCQWAGQTCQRSGLELSQWFWAHEQQQTCMERPKNCISAANWRSSAILSHQLFSICQELCSFCLACCFMESVDEDVDLILIKTVSLLPFDKTKNMSSSSVDTLVKDLPLFFHFSILCVWVKAVQLFCDVLF